MNPTYYLTVSGLPSMPGFSVALDARDWHEADRLSKPIVAQLSKAGYTRFSLFGANAKLLNDYMVDTPEPSVHVLIDEKREGSGPFGSRADDDF